MKRLFLAVTITVLLCGIGYAAEVPSLDIFKDFPAVKTGMAWDITNDSNDLYSLTTVDVVSWKQKLSIGAGLLSNGDDINVPAATLNYKIGGLEDLGFEYPLAKFVNVEVGGFAGKDFNGDGDWKVGLQASIIKIKFG